MSKKDKFRSQVIATVEEQPSAEIVPEDSAVEPQRMEGTRRMKNARLISIDKIKPDPNQPRKTFNEEGLTELADSIKQHGVLQPITVEHIEDEDYYKIISGERRYHASLKAEQETIPCIIFDGVDSKDRYAKQLIENIQREDFTPVEKARALLEYKDMLGPETVWEDVEKMVGISKSRRIQFLRLLNLPEQIQKEIVAIGSRPSKNMITEKHARALLALNDFPEQQLNLFDLIKNDELPITGEEAISKAKEFKGGEILKVLRITYKTETELIEILRAKLAELEAEFQED